MGFRLLDVTLPVGYSDGELRQKIARMLRIREFSWTLDRKSLDARKKEDIRWSLRVGVSSRELKGGEPPARRVLEIKRRPRGEKNRVVVIGSGPAGFFAAWCLLRGGFRVTLLEQGPDVRVRCADISAFEKGGPLVPRSNYAFGEGGAGTFSDGKLTSRTKSIAMERDFIFDAYVSAGAPREISWLTHPHVGSDYLRGIAERLRARFEAEGGEFLFNRAVRDLAVDNGRVTAAITDQNEEFPLDYLIAAPGHSCRESYRMLMRRGVRFRVKPFALGCRVEHEQSVINRAQWGCVSLPGVKAAEYRLTDPGADGTAVYTFCMCPGGRVVPAAAYPGTNIVNGMSYYARDGRFANAAVAAAVHPCRLAGEELTPEQTLDWLFELESSFYRHSGGYAAPACRIADFASGAKGNNLPLSSYPLGLTPADFRELLPPAVHQAVSRGLQKFSQLLDGFGEGVVLGLESKTSAPVQAIRDAHGRCEGFENLFIAGEGGGYAGGIISSGADGVRAAQFINSR